MKAPNANNGWKAHEPGKITWNRVDTDSPAFAVILVRQQPPFSQLINSHVDGGSPGEDHSITIPPPKGGFPVGDHYRVKIWLTLTLMTQFLHSLTSS